MDMDSIIHFSLLLYIPSTFKCALAFPEMMLPLPGIVTTHMMSSIKLLLVIKVERSNIFLVITASGNFSGCVVSKSTAFQVKIAPITLVEHVMLAFSPT